MKVVPPAVIAAIRAGAPIADERIQLLVQLVRSIVGTRGWPDQALVEKFYSRLHAAALSRDRARRGHEDAVQLCQSRGGYPD